MEGSRFLSVSDFEEYARGRHGQAEAYFNSGSFLDQTLKDNVSAYSRYRFRPRVLRDVSQRDMSTTVLGSPVSCPVGVAPMGTCCLAHPDGEMGIAKACERLQLPFGLSTVSTVSIENIAAGAPHSVRWFQLYIFKERRLTETLVRRAEAAGFSALVLTVDTPVAGRRLATMKEGFKFPDHLRLPNIDASDGIFESLRTEAANVPYLEIIGRQMDPSITWNDVKWLLKFTRLPVIVKGVLTAEDSREAVSQGVSAIWVSNHGGRQLDGVPASLDVLAEVVDAVGDRCEVYLDGGVRSGYDVIKAIAIGARAVFIGRPALWGLVHKGTEGVVNLLQLVKDEVDNAMALLGVTTISEVHRGHVVHESFLPKL
ncbi:2-Hydroxyacid oxidase 1-like isoform X1 [Haliotis rufescens]|uniref:2-Hydroxyacid oxidase 1-like isoform X1 n=1 Tax=Haliotis rufescens TaxID=6454 RepID=UPI00201E974F|nr:2-Hydroxyacid oxidase 1-like isoform X1 [Haliotis rufescens]